MVRVTANPTVPSVLFVTSMVTQIATARLNNARQPPLLIILLPLQLSTQTHSLGTRSPFSLKKTTTMIRGVKSMMMCKWWPAALVHVPQKKGRRKPIPSLGQNLSLLPLNHPLRHPTPPRHSQLLRLMEVGNE